MTVPWGCPNIPLEAGPGLKKIYHSAQWQLIIVNCTLDQVIPAALHPRNFVSQCPPTVNKLSWSYRKLHQRQSNSLGTPLTGTKPCPRPFQWSCQYRTIPNRIFSKLCLEFSSSVLKTDRFLFVVKLGFVNCLKIVPLNSWNIKGSFFQKMFFYLWDSHFLANILPSLPFSVNIATFTIIIIFLHNFISFCHCQIQGFFQRGFFHISND